MKKTFMSKIKLPLSLLAIVSALVACGPTSQPTSEVPTTSETPTTSEVITTNPTSEVTTTAPTSEENPTEGKKIVETSKFLFTPGGEFMQFNVAHYENEPEVLLIEINYAIYELITEFTLGSRPDTYVETEESSNTVKINRENNSYCEINWEEDTIYFNDYDLFSARDASAKPLDVLASQYLNAQDEERYLKRESSTYEAGNPVSINLAERNIPLDIYNGKKYIPLQTFNDIFVYPHGFNVVYNGMYIFIMGGNQLNPELAEFYYAEENLDRSAQLTEFNYNELCLLFDLNYGLQNERGITGGFDAYITELGLKEDFLKLDPISAYNALGNLTLQYLDDLHTGIVSGSSYLSEGNPTEGVDVTLSDRYYEHLELDETFVKARAEQIEEVKFYEKVGNTAYITFDEFTYGARTIEYTKEEIAIEDTLSIVYKSHELISKDPEIENVVLDLSCNGGGAIDSAVYLLSWMLGSCDVSVKNGVTMAQATTKVVADVNLDGLFDEKDNISDKNLYCLISPISFSCGNYVPAVLKASNKVTMLGQKSSGGTCLVGKATSADGSFFNISSSSQLTVVEDGVYKHLEDGVTPHYELTDIDSFYNRSSLTTYINSL